MVVLRTPEEMPPGWESALADVELAIADPSSRALADGTLDGAACVAVDGSMPDAIERLRRAHRADPTVQALVVASPAERPRIERAIVFAPGLGEVWIAAPEEIGAGLVERAGEITRKRRSFQATRGRIEREMASFAPQVARRAVVSDAYLAALLDAAPDPILSIDDTGLVLSWNPGAERVLGYTRGEAIGRPLAEVLVLAAGESPLRLGSDPASGPLRREIRFRRKNGQPGVGELTTVPVDVAGHRVRAVILHDLTEQRRAQEALEAQSAALQAQAAELATTNAKLHQRTQELEEASSARARFYAAMSHELRTPINAILGYQDLILAGIHGALPEQQRNGLERAQRAARHLVELVNDVLDLAKIEAGRIELQVESTNFPALIEELLDTVRSLADQHGSALAIKGEGTHTIQSDPRRVRQILLNLLSNAIKFGEGNPVEVKWRSLPDGGVRIDVADRGRGISPENLQRIFEEFTQVESGSDGGTGLGLPISRRLAQLLGGSLEVTSTIGQGSTFRLTLPAAAPQTAP